MYEFKAVYLSAYDLQEREVNINIPLELGEYNAYIKAFDKAYRLKEDYELLVKFELVLY